MSVIDSIVETYQRDQRLKRRQQRRRARRRRKQMKRLNGELPRKCLVILVLADIGIIGKILFAKDLIFTGIGNNITV